MTLINLLGANSSGNVAPARAKDRQHVPSAAHRWNILVFSQYTAAYTGQWQPGGKSAKQVRLKTADIQCECLSIQQ